MFILSTLEDNVRLAPRDLRERRCCWPPLGLVPPRATAPAAATKNLLLAGKPVEVAITAVLEQTFIDRVIADLGLVVTLYDILEVGDGYIYPGDGAAHYRVKFRVVVFHPFVGELLTGRVSKMDE